MAAPALVNAFLADPEKGEREVAERPLRRRPGKPIDTAALLRYGSIVAVEVRATLRTCRGRPLFRLLFAYLKAENCRAFGAERRRRSAAVFDANALLSKMKIVIAPDSFKGSLSAAQVAGAIAGGIRSLHPGWKIVEVPVADGGEGTVDAVLAALPGRRVPATVRSPLLTNVKAGFAVVQEGKTAVIEMAEASGLALVPEDRRNPLVTTTFGTGQLILRAIEEGCRRIFVGIGGSATVDGGGGMAAALGVKLLDDKGKDIPFGGGGLSRLNRIDPSGRIDVSGLEITALSDVSNPLLGQNGAARVFAPQKGATPEMVELLERNLAHFAQVVKRDLGVDVSEIPGAGAAGGLGAGIVAFLNGKIQSGIATIIDLVGFRDKIRGADLVITGEGKLDFQTVRGKAPAGVAKAASQLGVPVIAICGSLGEGAAEVARDHFLASISLAEIAGSQEKAMLRPKEFLKEAVARFLTDWPPPWMRASLLAQQTRCGRLERPVFPPGIRRRR